MPDHVCAIDILSMKYHQNRGDTIQKILHGKGKSLGELFDVDSTSITKRK